MAEAMTTLGGGEEPEEEFGAEDGEEGGGLFNNLKKGFDKARQNSKKGKEIGEKEGEEAAKETGKAAAGEEIGKKAGEKAGKEVGKKAGKKVAEKGAKETAKAARAGLAGPLGYTIGELIGRLLFDERLRKILYIIIVVILLGIAFLIWLIVMMILLAFAGGHSGGTEKIKTDLNNPEHVKTIDQIETFTKLPSPACLASVPPCTFAILEFADPKDLELIKKGEIDYRVLLAIKELASKTDRLKISHVANLMQIVPANTIETHSDVENEYIDNISAHKDGMAFDIVEIGTVYEKCTCSKQCGCKKIPAKVAWQERNMAGIGREAGLSQITDLLGFPGGALDGRNIDEVFQNTGLAELERKFRVAQDTFERAKDLPDFLKAYGQAEIENALRLPSGSLRDQNSLADYASETGRREMEKILKLPPGSLRGSAPSVVEKNTGQKSAEKELNIPDGWLTAKPRDAHNYLKNLDLSSQEKQRIEQQLGWPQGSVNKLIVNLKDNNTAGVSSTLVSIGKKVLEQAIGLPKDNLDHSGTPPFNSAQGQEKDIRYSLPGGTFTLLVTALKNGQSINGPMIAVGAKNLESGLALPMGSVEDIVYGRRTVAQVVAESERYGTYINSFLSTKLRIPEEEARALKNDLLNGRGLSPRALAIGSQNIERYFNLRDGSLAALVSNQISLEQFLRTNGSAIMRKAEALGIPGDAINQIFSGDINGAAQKYGQEIIAKTFKINANQLISWVQSGNLQGLIENEVIKVVAQVLGIDAGLIMGILTGNINPASLISLGFSILYGGPLGGIFAGIFGGLFGGACSTDCYQPTARANVRKTIGQLLNLGKKDPNLKPTQIITYRKADVTHFSSLVDELYGNPRPINYGLFQRDETRGHIHVGY